MPHCAFISRQHHITDNITQLLSSRTIEGDGAQRRARHSLCGGFDGVYQQPVGRISAETRRATQAPHGGPLRSGSHPPGWLTPWVGIHGSGTAVGCCPALARAGGAPCVPHDVFAGHGGPDQSRLLDFVPKGSSRATRKAKRALVKGVKEVFSRLAVGAAENRVGLELKEKWCSSQETLGWVLSNLLAASGLLDC